jgi:hypothetical protein
MLSECSNEAQRTTRDRWQITARPTLQTESVQVLLKTIRHGLAKWTPDRLLSACDKNPRPVSIQAESAEVTVLFKMCPALEGSGRDADPCQRQLLGPPVSAKSTTKPKGLFVKTLNAKLMAWQTNPGSKPTSTPRAQASRSWSSRSAC